MSDIFLFKRIEKKYRLTSEKKALLLSRLQPLLVPDVHGVSTICSLYLDTPSFLIIRNSIEAKDYKEKLRIRSYGVPSADSKVFFEIKKKYDGVVYKRRVSMRCDEAVSYIHGGIKPASGQIMDEIDWAMHYYENPLPRTAIFYEREAYTVKNCDSLRITFDRDIRYRTDELEAPRDSRGKKIIPDGTTLMEIKTAGAMPVWLSHILNEYGIFPSSFSKYGTSYLDFMGSVPQDKGEYHHV